jgi:Ketopantoate reductase PanE/ApbA
MAFVARGAHLAALRERGLIVESKLGDVSLPKVQATDDPSTLGSVDAVLIGVKLWDTEAAAHAAVSIWILKSRIIASLADELRSGPYSNKNILVCWHHGKIPELLASLGADPQKLLPPKGKWPEDIRGPRNFVMRKLCARFANLRYTMILDSL